MAYVTLSSKAIGSTIKLKVNGSARNFIVVHQGKPSSVYDDSCNGTWLLMQDIYENRACHPEGLSPPVGQDPEGSAVRARSVPYPAHTSNSITKYTENSHHITKKPLTNPRFVIDLFW